MTSSNGQGMTVPSGPFALQLPSSPVPDRVSITAGFMPNRTATWADLEGPGCIKHIWITLSHPKSRPLISRKIIIRIYFDDAKTPQVEAPVGDFFGVMHGLDNYDINTPFLSVKALNGYNCYFEMPFAKRAQIELVNGPDHTGVYLQVDWHRYPGQEMTEARRFCARWRREMPTDRYGAGFLMLDADGPGDLVGFVYGVRLIDNVDRWSHGGAENIYIDGSGDYPAFIRGIGGEDTFGTSYGGAIHPPETHLHAGMPYYVHEDTGEARVAQRLVGYRFFAADRIPFRESIHLRFGAMKNDICATTYWYQASPLRSFVKMPDWPQMLAGVELTKGTCDLPLPDNGSWLIGPVLENQNAEAVENALKATVAGDFWEGARQETLHGFIDFTLVHRPQMHGVGTHYRQKAAEARAMIEVEADMKVSLRISWDDRLVLRVNSAPAIDMGTHTCFRERTLEVALRKGRNLISVVLTNEQGSNHGGWIFAFRALTTNGVILLPRAEDPTAK